MEPLDSGQVLYGAPDGAGVIVVRLPDCVVVNGSSLAAKLGRESSLGVKTWTVIKAGLPR